ncbi:hypothetical protein AWC12_07235 [Mycolicibacterium iranicum]|uniref:Uncharacterized protein n=1 Tax=Mycolicibacterium iranicum TaxID=912594 RepID=A0A1X1WVE9_MYCIR|nr:hypothetical protein AWC12_07235 [Mycolicibacterium iranicum]
MHVDPAEIFEIRSVRMPCGCDRDDASPFYLGLSERGDREFQTADVREEAIRSVHDTQALLAIVFMTVWYREPGIRS